MTYPTPPARAGMPTWAKWTLGGCGGCLLLCVLAFGGCAAFFMNMMRGSGTFDVSDKPDPPLTAKAGQLLPPRVDGFVRKSVTRFSQQVSGPVVGTGWQGSYVANGKKVEVVLTTTASTQQARNRNSPFGNSMQRQNRSTNLKTGFHMKMKMGGQSVDMVIWSKPNWTVTIQSPDMVAVQFAKAYRPAVAPGR